MKPTYRVKDWDRFFETTESRKVINARWVPLPNKQDGKGYRRVAQHKNGVAIFCAWTLILQVASKTPTRGVLADHDGPLDAEDLAVKTGFPMRIFEQALAFLSDSRVGWITSDGKAAEPADIPADGAGSSADARLEGKGIEEKGIEQKRESVAAQARRVFAFWQGTFRHQHAAFDSKRERFITDRLKQGYTVEQLQDAAKGCKASRYHQGENESKTVYDRVDLIYRDAEHVDMFIAKLPQDNGGPKKPPTETEAERSARESCERCHATGTEIIPGRGARPCDHARVSSASSPIIGSAFEDCEARVS